MYGFELTNPRPQSHHHAAQILPLQILKLPHPVPLGTLFPPSVQIPPAHREDAATAANNTPDNASVDEASINGNGTVPKKPSKFKAGGGPAVEELKFIDYRYYRFLLHPDGMFRMVRYVAREAGLLQITTQKKLTLIEPPQGLERPLLDQHRRAPSRPLDRDGPRLPQDPV